MGLKRDETILEAKKFLILSFLSKICYKFSTVLHTSGNPKNYYKKNYNKKKIIETVIVYVCVEWFSYLEFCSRILQHKFSLITKSFQIVLLFF